MGHETSLIVLIAVGLVLAFAGGFAASRLRISPIVGYLLAGMIIGPYTPGYVADQPLASQLAEVGVILLMFGVGLHFSIADLLAVRRIAVPGAVGQIAIATAIGAGLAAALGWSLGAGLVFGLALSVASTVVLLRALDEANRLDTPDGHIAVGWLVVEDLAMVLALVLLPALAESLGGAGGEVDEGDVLVSIAITIGKVVAFIALMLVGGKRAVPWLLGQAARTGSREIFTLAVLALALGIAYGSAELFDVSFALGAFFAGVVLSESELSHQAAADSLPLQDAFAVLFFVSVGMLFDPSIIVSNPLPVLGALAIVVFGKSLAAFAIVLVFGYPVSTALIVSASLAQIGEFSFILAGLGVSLKLLPIEGQDLLLAAALMSIALNPLVFAATHRLEAWLGARPRLTAALERRRAAGTAMRAADHAGEQHGHAVIVGYGRVGGRIGEALEAHGLPFTAVEHDRRRVEALRARGVPAIYGDAMAEGVLKAADIEGARLLVLAAPVGFKAQRIIELARRHNPEIDTVVRTHSEAELLRLKEQGAGLAIMAERELAIAMAGYALRCFGVSADEAHIFAEQARRAGAVGDLDHAHEGHGPPRPAPELRPRHERGDGDA